MSTIPIVTPLRKIHTEIAFRTHVLYEYCDTYLVFNFICLVTGTCVNTPGSFHCVCDDGWEGERCEREIDECLSNPCQHDGTCLNKVGKFTCLCMNGKCHGVR